MTLLYELTDTKVGTEVEEFYSTEETVRAGIPVQYVPFVDNPASISFLLFTICESSLLYFFLSSYHFLMHRLINSDPLICQ